MRFQSHIFTATGKVHEMPNIMQSEITTFCLVVLRFQSRTVLLTKRGKNENVPFFSHNSVTKHDVEKTITFLESACIFASSCEFMLYHVIGFRFRTTTSNIGLKQHFSFITHECNGVNVSNLQHNCTIIVCTSLRVRVLFHNLISPISIYTRRAFWARLSMLHVIEFNKSSAPQSIEK